MNGRFFFAGRERGFPSGGRTSADWRVSASCFGPPGFLRAFGGALELAGRSRLQARTVQVVALGHGSATAAGVRSKSGGDRMVDHDHAISPTPLWRLRTHKKRVGRTPVRNDSGVLVASLPARIVQRINRKRYKLLSAFSFSCVSVACGASRQGRPALAKMTVGRRHGFRDSAACSTVVKASECRAIYHVFSAQFWALTKVPVCSRERKQLTVFRAREHIDFRCFYQHLKTAGKLCSVSCKPGSLSLFF